MPTYEYRPVDEQAGCDACRDGLEVLQQMSDDALESCPECGATIARVFSGCSVNTKPSAKTLMSDSNLKRLGFQKFQRGEKGYERRV